MDRIDNSEIPLQVSWLNNRERFDGKARNGDVLKRFLNHTSEHQELSIADFGSGTASNILYLSRVIDRDVNWYLIEREAELINEAKRRIKTHFENVKQESDEVYHATLNGKSFSFYMYNETIESFMKREVSLNAATSSALFDLFTKEEFINLFKLLVARKIPLYGVLNYSGISFDPSMDSDQLFISHFEQHMSRNLEKGSPMGKHTMETIQTIVDAEFTASISVGNSDWKIPSREKKFILQNFEFYEEGIRSCMIDHGQLDGFNKWIKERHNQINDEKIKLIVFHQDFMINYLSN
ncbi:MAG: hypothetical protein ACJA2S_000459 [Cyclobacteriaceae bacterium]|jgi:hypothetical protein